MKKVKLLGVALMAVMFLSSCGGGSKEPAKVKPDKTKISGPLGNYLQIVDGEYEIVDDWGGNLNIKIKRIKKAPDEFLVNKEFDLTASILQENGMPVSGTEDFKLDYNSKDKIISILKGNSDEEIVLLKSLLGGYHQEEHAEKAKKFSVSSFLKEKEETSSSSSTSSSNKSYSNSSSSKSVSNEDWDAVLDDYEDYVDKYIKYYKKAMKGDMNAISEYPALMEKATSLSEKLEKAKGDMTAKQIGRMSKIQTKMLQAATGN